MWENEESNIRPLACICREAECGGKKGAAVAEEHQWAPVKRGSKFNKASEKAARRMQQVLLHNQGAFQALAEPETEDLKLRDEVDAKAEAEAGAEAEAEAQEDEDDEVHEHEDEKKDEDACSRK